MLMRFETEIVNEWWKKVDVLIIIGEFKFGDKFIKEIRKTF